MKKYLEKLTQLEAVETLLEDITINYFVNILSIQSMNVGIKTYKRLLEDSEKVNNTGLTNIDRKKWLLKRLHHHISDRAILISQLNYDKVNLDELRNARKKLMEEMSDGNL